MEPQNENIKPLWLLEAIHKRPAMFTGNISDKSFIETILFALKDVLDSSNLKSIELSFFNRLEGKILISEIASPMHNAWKVDVMKKLRNRRFFSFEFKVLNALSKSFNVELMKEGKVVLQQEYENGRLLKTTLEKETYDCDQIIIEYQLEPSIWQNIKWNNHFYVEQLKSFAYLNCATKISINYFVKGESCKTIYNFENGFVDKLETLALDGHGDMLFKTCIKNDFERFELDIAFAFRWYKVDRPKIESYVNDYLSWQNGSHVDGLLLGLKNAISKYIETTTFEIERNYEVSNENIKKTLVAFINISMEDANYSGSTKDHLNNPEIVEPISKIVELAFGEKLRENTKETLQFLNGFAV